jgi:hypothetical protein
MWSAVFVPFVSCEKKQKKMTLPRFCNYYLRPVYIGDDFYGYIAGNSNMLQSHRAYGQLLLTCLGHLRGHNINRNDSISVALPKVAKASK